MNSILFMGFDKDSTRLFSNALQQAAPCLGLSQLGLSKMAFKKAIYREYFAES
jgi:hypothetical protein